MYPTGSNFIFVITAFWWIVLFVSFTHDRSRYRNCYFLFFALFHTLAAIPFLSIENRGALMVALILIITLALLIVPGFLIANGIVMIRREGRGLSTILSLLFGIVIGIGELATFLLVFGAVFLQRGDTTYMDLLNKVGPFALIVSVSVIYVSMSFLIFMFYTLFLQLIPHKRDFDYVIIHGAGLIGGRKVSKLLADRIDKAIMVYTKDPTPPFLIPSGGKGYDEEVSEAEAMSEYLREKGIPEEKILLEDKSTTTFENLENSKEIIDSLPGRKYVALVTSNYHVYRALRYCRKIGLKCVGIGSHVAFYYWPSALIREYVAVHAEKKHLIAFIGGWLLCMIPCILVLIA